MVNPETFHFALPADRRPTLIPLVQEMHPECLWLSSKRGRARPRDYLNVIDTVVVHATAGYATEHAVATWKQRKASAHWVVPDENEPAHGSFVWNTVLEDKAAYHVKDGIDPTAALGPGPNTNNRSLGIEIVNTQDVQNFSDPFSDWQIAVTAQIILYAWAKYRNLKHIISHAKLDPENRKDPGANFPWNELMQAVLSHSLISQPNPMALQPFIPAQPPTAGAYCCEP